MSAAKGTEFRWRYRDDAVGDHWSRWHGVALPCAACCCCGGPDEGEHQEDAEYYDELGDELGLASGHARCDPIDPDFECEIEWR